MLGCHRWVNEGYPGSCLDLAEELANQTPVRLDVLLSLTPSAVTSDQLVVPNTGEETKTNERVARSHSVGSIRDMANTEAERRILDMVAAGGEAALAPSPTRTITPSESPAQPKRKLEMGASTESVLGITSKKDKPTEGLRTDPSRTVLQEAMDEDLLIVEPTVQLPDSPSNETTEEEKQQAINAIEMCDELLTELMASEEPAARPSAEVAPKTPSPEKKKVLVKKKLVKPQEAAAEEPAAKPVAKKSPVKVIKKIIAKTKTSDMNESLSAISPDKEHPPVLERKFSLPDENLKPSTERRKSRIFETAEKFQAMNSPTATLEKPKKIVIPGVSVGNFKKEFERKASLTSGTVPSMVERRCMYEKRGSDSSGEHGTGEHSRKSSIGEPQSEPSTPTYAPDELPKLPCLKAQAQAAAAAVAVPSETDREREMTEFTSFSLKEARRSMENSIALLNQAKTESNKEVDQLCAKTEGVSVSEPAESAAERLKKIRAAREIIGNAIPVGRATGMGNYKKFYIYTNIKINQIGVRKPPVPFGLNGRSVSGSVVPSSSVPMADRKTLRVQMGADPNDVRLATLSVSTPEQKTFDRGEMFAGQAKRRPLICLIFYQVPKI